MDRKICLAWSCCYLKEELMKCLYFPENCIWLLGLMVNRPVFHCKRGILFFFLLFFLLFPKNATFFQFLQVPEDSSSFYTRWYLTNLLVVYEPKEYSVWIYGSIFFLTLDCQSNVQTHLLFFYYCFCTYFSMIVIKLWNSTNGSMGNM